MTFEELHREEARAQEHDQDPMELAGVAPPCARCGKREREPESRLCEDCE
jgi:hypothetical protein